MATTMAWEPVPVIADVDMQGNMFDPWETVMEAEVELGQNPDTESVEIDMDEATGLDVDEEAALQLGMPEDPSAATLDADVEFQDASAIASPSNPAFYPLDEDTVVDLTTDLNEDVAAVQSHQHSDEVQVDEWVEPFPLDTEAPLQPDTELSDQAEPDGQDVLVPDVAQYEASAAVELLDQMEPPELPATMAVKSQDESSDEVQENAQEDPSLRDTSHLPPPENASPPEETESADPPVGSTDHLETSEPLAPLDPHAVADSYHDSEGDPHEIGDGIYIDPPPPVALSLPSGASLVYLFNRPPTRSNSPTTSDTANQEAPPAILLQNLPTRYYEPLSSLFESLRETADVANLPEVAESELFIDVEDLKLSISEDNVFAREISVHDLSVLRDGTLLPGPLSLSLRLSSPRFILRYRMMEAETRSLTLQDIPPGVPDGQDGRSQELEPSALDEPVASLLSGASNEEHVSASPSPEQSSDQVLPSHDVTQNAEGSTDTSTEPVHAPLHENEDPATTPNSQLVSDAEATTVAPAPDSDDIVEHWAHTSENVDANAALLEAVQDETETGLDEGTVQASSLVTDAPSNSTTADSQPFEPVRQEAATATQDKEHEQPPAPLVIAVDTAYDTEEPDWNGAEVPLLENHGEDHATDTAELHQDVSWGFLAEAEVLAEEVAEEEQLEHSGWTAIKDDDDAANDEEQISNQSSTTLRTSPSKRSFDEIDELDVDDDSETPEKRLRVE